jgi:hypothetical protein
MKIIGCLIVTAAVFTAIPAAAQMTVSQGNGSTAVAEWRMNASANRAGDTAEVCVTNAAGGTTITNLASRKAIELQNLGPNPIYCTVDGGAPLATGAHGRKIAADSVWSLDAGASITIKCIAATAAQVTAACTMVTQLR